MRNRELVDGEEKANPEHFFHCVGHGVVFGFHGGEGD